MCAPAVQPESKPTGGYLFREPPAHLAELDGRRLLRYIGPGAIIASVTIGSGELVWASRSGAIFGYAMLWCFLYAGVFKAVQVYTGVRHLTLTGEHPMATWSRLPGPRCWFPLLLIAPALPIMPVALSTISETVGGFIHTLTGAATNNGEAVHVWTRPEFFANAWGTLTLVACFAVSRLSSYTVLERLSLGVVVALVVLIGASVVASSPSPGEAVAGLLVPRVPDFSPWIVSDPRYAGSFANWSPWLEVSLYLLAVGGGTHDYLGYVGMVREKRWGLAGGPVPEYRALAAAVNVDCARGREELRRARVWLRAPLLDTIASFAVVIVVTLLFALLGAALLHPLRQIPDGNDLLTVQESFLTQLHGSLTVFYRIAVFLALGGTLYGLFPVYGATLAEAANVIRPQSTKRSSHAGKPSWMTSAQYILLAVSLVLIWLPSAIAGDIVTRTAFATMIGGATSTALWLFAMLWVDACFTPPALRIGPGLKWLIWLSAFTMFALGIRSLVAFFA